MSLEWKISVPGSGSKELVPQTSICRGVWLWLSIGVTRIVDGIWRVMLSFWSIGVNEPRKFYHALKVSLALCVVSLFYYMRPLYDGFGGNAMWAVMTVVVVFEYTVGATLSKCINRTIATVLGGSLGIGVDWIANQSGADFRPFILGASVFIFAGVATFSRFIPKVKARFDYGAMIFILTFSLVSVSGYRVDKLFMLAHQRVSTIMIGTALCILISMFIYPVWAGEQLHNQIIHNLEKLANSLQACVDDYFENMEDPSASKCDANKRYAYKCVLSSMASEDAMANLARWEPAHGKFGFKHPWQLYLKISVAMRNFAYCIDNLNSCLNLEVQVPSFLKKSIDDECLKVSAYSSEVLKELATVIREMKRSSKVEAMVGEMNYAVQELNNALKLISGEQTEKKANTVSLFEVLPLAAMVALLTETVSRTEEIVDEVNELAKSAEFEGSSDRKCEENKPPDDPNTLGDQEQQPSKMTYESYDSKNGSEAT